ncbi:DNA recombination/repair protein RecA, partial [Thermodesulfobacteriota bacterium]
GSWYSYEGERMGQGRENVKQFFKENTDICNSIFSKVRDAMGLSTPAAEAETTQEELPAT